MTGPRALGELMLGQILGPLPAEPHHTVENKQFPMCEQEIPSLKKSPAAPTKLEHCLGFTDKDL